MAVRFQIFIKPIMPSTGEKINKFELHQIRFVNINNQDYQ